MNKKTRTQIKQLKRKETYYLKRMSGKSSYRHYLLAIYHVGYIPYIAIVVSCIKKAPKRRYNTILKQRMVTHNE